MEEMAEEEEEEMAEEEVEEMEEDEEEKGRPTKENFVSCFSLYAKKETGALICMREANDNDNPFIMN